ncbi:MAG: nuclear transport factor 2 family protein [Bacteroidota bacterium]
MNKKFSLPVAFFRASLAIFLWLGFTFSTQAQQVSRGGEAQTSAAADIINEQLTGFAKAYSSVNETKDKNSVLKYISPNARTTIFYFSISDKVRVTNSSYDGFAKYLEKVIATENLQISYEIEEVLYTSVNGDVGSSVAKVNYELMEENGFHTKGSEIVTMAWKRTPQGWKIVHFTVLGTEDEKLRGTCLCEVFASKGSEYVVRTTVPDGRSYETSFNDFEVYNSKGGRYIKANKQDMFVLTEQGEVWLVDRSNIGDNGPERVKKLGSAKEDKGAILLIIKSHLYPDKCSSVKYEK